MKQILLILIFSGISTFAYAAAQINHFEVNNNIVKFMTSEVKVHSTPTCITPDLSEFWAVDIDTSEGRAAYSVLLTAISNGLTITVQTSDECLQGVERAESVSIQF